MKIIAEPLELQNVCQELKSFPKSMGFVPTMGCLHAGHGQLIQRSVLENDVTVVSLFLNPTQFDNKEDLEKYPKTLAADLKFCEDLGVSVVFAPKTEAMYPDDYRYQLTEKEVSTQLCGAHRKGHFDGVLTIVLKLFNLVTPHKAYFGEKDFQQLYLVKKMTEALFLPIEVVPCETVRLPNGLPLSSRNKRLSSENLEQLKDLSATLKNANSADEAKLLLEKNNLNVEYVEDWQQRRFAALFINNVRIIDNVPI